MNDDCEYKYWLPDSDGTRKDYITEKNSVVIIGANGAGKSKLGAWIESQDWEKVHRIGAQRKIDYNENFTLKSYEQAENEVYYGSIDKNSSKGQRWDWGKYTTHLITDFESVLAAIIALKNNENDEYVAECTKAEQEGKAKPPVRDTSITKLQKLWNTIFPQRQLICEDSKFYATFKKTDGTTEKYSANQMSDGERSVLYMTAQVLCVPKDKILIIDEPEVHLHRSLMNRLWLSLEQYRTDCLFIYITHDTQFASLHGDADKYWVRDFDGVNWHIESIKSEDLPEDLLLDILGNRNNVLFVEGDSGSFDVQLYSVLYPSYHVIPCGSCTQVIGRTKAFNNSKMIHHCKVYGLIDRDYRTDTEINALKSDGIYTLGIAEVENLFIVEDVVKAMSAQLARDENADFNQVKDFVINTKFANMINRQICQAAVAEIKYQLSIITIDKKNDIAAQASLTAGLSSIDYNKVRTSKNAEFRSALNSKDYKEVLKIFNEKQIAKSVGHYLGIKDDEYIPTILRLLHKTDGPDRLKKAFANYLPAEIPQR